MSKNKSVCVIGGAGFIGSHIVDQLAKEGHYVTILDNFSSGKKKNINHKEGIRYVKYDIRRMFREMAEYFRLWGTEWVFHLAAEPFIPDCYERPKEFFEVNANGTMNVLLACKEANVKKIIYYSSSEVYGTVKDDFIAEDYPTNPQSTYAVSKLAGDRLCFTMFHEHKIPVIILRQFNCVGPRETHDYVIPEIISQLSKSRTLKLGNIKSQRDFIYVEDAARMAIELIKKGRVGEVYNLGTGREYSVLEIAQTIGGIMGVSPKIKIDKKRLRPFDVDYLRADTRKIFHIIKQRPDTELVDGLSKTIQYFYKNNGW